MWDGGSWIQLTGVVGTPASGGGGAVDLSAYVTTTAMNTAIQNFIEAGDITVQTGAASGGGSLSYNNGQFTFNPAVTTDLTGYATETYVDDSIATLTGGVTIPSDINDLTDADGLLGGVIFATELITVTDTAWSPTVNASLTFIALGSGGTGAIVAQNDGGTGFSVSETYTRSGGGAGGFVMSDSVAATTTDTFNVQIGAQVTVSGNSNQNGIDGNTTTLTGGGMTLTANGGGGGTWATNATATGGAGGIATGGNLNIIGGSADDAVDTTAGRQTAGGIPAAGLGFTNSSLEGLLTFGVGGDGEFTSRDGIPSSISSTVGAGAVLVLYS
jgi:hypothetical protein